MKPLLKIQNLNISIQNYDKRYPVVKDFSLTIHEKETIGLVGESGSGKSILAKSILGLQPKQNTDVKSGKILYGDDDLAQLPEKKMQRIRSHEIAMIFQDPLASLNPTMPIGKQIAESVRLVSPKLSRKVIYKEVVTLLSLVGIPLPEERFYQYSYELSGGMRQRVMIAMALARKPKLLIADEPTTALDVTIQEQILSLLEDLQKKLGMSILFITHDLSLAARFVDRLVVMYNGSILEQGPIKALFCHPHHPYTQKLIEAIPCIDDPLEKKLISIKGSPPTIYDTFKGCSFAPRCPKATKKCHTEKPQLKQCGKHQLCACFAAETAPILTIGGEQ